MRGLDHFSLLAPFYDRIFSEFDPAQLRGLLSLPAGRLLDVGGGTGRIAALLAGEAGLVVVTDASTRDARRSSRQAASPRSLRARGAPAVSRRLLRPSAGGGRVHHFRNHQEAARELLRVVRPGGRLVVEEMNLERWQVKLIALGERLLLMGSRFYTPAALRQVFDGLRAKVTVRTNDTIAVWVVVDKTENTNDD